MLCWRLRDRSFSTLSMGMRQSVRITDPDLRGTIKELAQLDGQWQTECP